MSRRMDRSTHMLLVGGSQAAVENTVKDCVGWAVLPQTTVPLPNLRKKISNKVRG